MFFYPLYSSSFQLRCPGFERADFRDLSAAHADESDMVCFVTKPVAFLICHVSLSYQHSNYKIQSPAFLDAQGSSALQFVLIRSVPSLRPCNLMPSLSHYPFLGMFIDTRLPLEMLSIYLSQQSSFTNPAHTCPQHNTTRYSCSALMQECIITKTLEENRQNRPQNFLHLLMSSEHLNP